jgi:large subunit ribosomal protein L32e
MKVLLEIRKKLKAKKPTFLRTDSNRKKYKNNWRKPRGLHNKRRLGFKGHQKNPSQGYRSPLEVRGLHTSGLELVIVSNLNDLNNIKETQIVEIASNVGKKNKIKILEECKTKKLQVSNVKNIDKFIADVKSNLESNKKQKTKKAEEKKKSKASSVKKAEEEKKKEDETKETKETQEEVKEEILKSKPKEEKPKKETKQKNTTTQKEGHQHSSVPGNKQ